MLIVRAPQNKGVYPLFHEWHKIFLYDLFRRRISMPTLFDDRDQERRRLLVYPYRRVAQSYLERKFPRRDRSFGGQDPDAVILRFTHRFFYGRYDDAKHLFFRIFFRQMAMLDL